jgi:RHS repeat-associated protein
MIFDKTGSLAGTKRHDYLPFGEELYANVGIRSTTLGYTAAGNTAADKVRQKFTEQERDDETNLDYMHARYFANVQGRFTSVDPSQASARPGSPQSWNRYSYALNDPLRYSDPSGLTEFDDLRGPGVGNPQDSEEEERHRQQEYLAQQAANEADAAALEGARNGQAGSETLIVRGTYDGAEPNAADGSGPAERGSEEGPGGDHQEQQRDLAAETERQRQDAITNIGYHLTQEILDAIQNNNQSGQNIALVICWAAVESSLDPNANGRQHERGLFQLKLKTAKTIEPKVTAEQLYNPSINTRIATQVLNNLVSEFGSVRTGLIVYKQGRRNYLNNGETENSTVYVDGIIGCSKSWWSVPPPWKYKPPN